MTFEYNHKSLKGIQSSRLFSKVDTDFSVINKILFFFRRKAKSNGIAWQLVILVVWTFSCHLRNFAIIVGFIIMWELSSATFFFKVFFSLNNPRKSREKFPLMSFRATFDSDVSVNLRRQDDADSSDVICI